MLRLIDEGKALEIQNRYYSILEKTGYLKHDAVLRFLIYLFLLDFVDYTHSFFTEEDYKKIAKALGILFSGGNCLMPYPVFCVNRITLGRPEYMGQIRVRKTEDLSGYEDRYTEDEKPRII